MWFGKKRARAEDVARDLAKYAIGGANDHQQERERPEVALFMVFLVDFAVQSALGSSSQAKDAVLDQFYPVIQDKLASMFGELCSAGRIQDRMSVYATAVNTPHDMGPAWQVGKAYAASLGHEFDPRQIMMGQMLFGQLVPDLMEYVREVGTSEV